MQVRELMTTDVVTIGWHNDLRLVDDIMVEFHIHHLPVLADGEIVGLVTQRDVYNARMSCILGYEEMSQRTFLHTVSVKEMMTHPVRAISPNASISDAS